MMMWGGGLYGRPRPCSFCLNRGEYIPYDLCQPNTAIIPVGTPAAPASCRDNGWRGVDVGALCLSGVGWSGLAHHHTPKDRAATRTSTRPPPFPISAPCPYRTGD